MKKPKKKRAKNTLKKAERVICRNVQIERLPGNKTRLVSPYPTSPIEDEPEEEEFGGIGPPPDDPEDDLRSIVESDCGDR